MTHRLSICLLVVLCVFPNIVLAQRIAGQVLDSETGQPLPGVHVFYKGTTFGDASGAMGKFELPAPPVKGIEIVFSMVGYSLQVLQTSNVNTSEQLVVRLQPITMELGDVIVNGELDREWRRNLERFKEIFFNNTDFGQQCILVKPEILDFEYNSTTKLLKAKATEPLIVVNKALGYTLEFYAFALEGSSDFYQWSGSVFFKEIASSDTEETELWERNRHIAYQGSVKHLFSALANGKLVGEQFRVYQDFLPRSAFIGVPIPEMGDDFRGKYEEGDSLYVPILFPGDTSEMFSVRAPFSLTVQYLGEPESDRYDSSYGTRGPEKQTSWVHFGGATIQIDRFGNRLSNRHISEIGVIGYMGWERIGELLPREYPIGNNSN